MGLCIRCNSALLPHPSLASSGLSTTATPLAMNLVTSRKKNQTGCDLLTQPRRPPWGHILMKLVPSLIKHIYLEGQAHNKNMRNTSLASWVYCSSHLGLLRLSSFLLHADNWSHSMIHGSVAFHFQLSHASSSVSIARCGIRHNSWTPSAVLHRTLNTEWMVNKYCSLYC